MVKPKVFINNISKDLKNNRSSFHFKREDNIEINDSKVDSVDVSKKINEIFNSELFVYKYDAVITLKNGNRINEEIIALKNGELITLNNNKIKIEDIKDIKKAN